MTTRMTARVLVAAAISAAAAAAGIPAAYATNGTFASNGNQYPGTPLATIDGTVPAAWSGGLIPNAPGDTATFNYNVNSFLQTSGNASTITLPASMTLGTLNIQADGGMFYIFGKDLDYQLHTASGSLVMDNGAGQAHINVLPTTHAVTFINSDLLLNSDTVVNAAGGPLLRLSVASIDPASTKNLILEGGGQLGINGGNAFANSRILVNHGTFVVENNTGNMFGSGAGAGIYMSQGGTLQAGSAGAVTYTAPIHLSGTGNRLNGALVFDGTIEAASSGVVLDGNASIASIGTINTVISDAGGNKALTVSFSASQTRGLTLGGVNTYAGGTFVPKLSGPLTISPTGSVMNNITVAGGAIVGLSGTGNLTNGGKVILQAGTPTNAIGTTVGSSSGNVINPNGDFTTVGGILRLDADFDPVNIIDATSTGGVALGINAATNFNVAAWGDGSLRFGALNTTTGGDTTNVVRDYTGTLSAVRGSPTVLRLGYTGSEEGVFNGVYSKATLQISSPIGSVSGVDIKSGVVQFNAVNTYTGATNIGFDGTLNLTGAGTITGGGAVNVNGGGTLNLTTAGGVVSGPITINGYGTANMSAAGVATGLVTVKGVDPANGMSLAYHGLLNYNVTGAVVPTGGGVIIGQFGEVQLGSGMTPTAADKFTLNSSGALRGTSTQLSALTPGGNLIVNPGGVIQNLNSAGGRASISTLVTALGTTPSAYYGFVGGTTTVDTWTIGDTAGSGPWLGLASGNEETANTGAAAVINLTGNAYLAGLASQLSVNNAPGLGTPGGGSGNTSNIFSFTVNGKITGTATSLNIRGGGRVQINNAANDFTALVVVDEDTTLDVGGLTAVGNAANQFMLQNGGRVAMTANNTTRVFNLGVNGGGIRTNGPSAALSASNLLIGSTRLTVLGATGNVLNLQATNPNFTGPVNVLGATLYLSGDGLAAANSINLGFVPDGLVPPVVSLIGTAALGGDAAASNFPVWNTGINSFGSLLLNPTGTYTGPAANISGIALNGGALGYTADKTLDVTTLNLGTQTLYSSLAVKPVAQDSINGLQAVQGDMQLVKLLHLGGSSTLVNGNMVLTNVIADSGGTAVLLMKAGHNMTLDLRSSGPNTYSGGTLIYNGNVAINNANQLGTGAVEVLSVYSSSATSAAGRLHIMDNGTDHLVTFTANQFFRFQGSSTTVGTAGTFTVIPAYIDVDNGVTATISSIDNSLTTGGMIAKTGLGTLKVNIAQNLLSKAGLAYQAYLGAGTLEVDALPAGTSSSQREVIFDGGNLTVHAPPAAAQFGDLLNGSNYGFTDMQVRDTKTSTVTIDSGATFVVTSNGSAASTWNGTLIINGADASALALFSVASGNAVSSNANGVLDIRGGRVAVINDNATGKMVPWDTATFTLNLQGGELDGNDYQSVNVNTNPPTTPINANIVITNAFGTPILGGPLPTTIAGTGSTNWNGALIKNGSGILTFNRTGGTFAATANAALTINGGQVVIDGNDVFANSGFQSNRVPIVNNSVTDTGTGYGLLFKSNDATFSDRAVKSITGTGGTQVPAGVTVVVGNTGPAAGIITQALLDVAGNLRTDGDLTLANTNSALSGAVTITGANSAAFNIEGTGVAKLGDVTLSGAGTGGVLATGGNLTVHSLTISQPTGTFTQQSGSSLTIDPLITNNGTYTFNGGTLTGTSGGVTMTSGNLTQGSLLVNANLALDAVRQGVKVQVASGTVLTLNANGSGVQGGANANFSRIGSLVLANPNGADNPGTWTSTLDVNDNKLILDNANQATTAATYLRTLDQVKTAAAEDVVNSKFLWNGNGITSSKVNSQQNVSHQPVMLGVLNNNANDPNNPNKPFLYGDGVTDQNGDGNPDPLFAGQAVGANDVLMRYTWFGDADLNGVVNSVDYSLFLTGATDVNHTHTGWMFGDFDYNGVIDSVDYSLFLTGASQGQMTNPAGGPSSLGAPGAVPEPASLALLGLGGLLLLKRRNHKS